MSKWVTPPVWMALAIRAQDVARELQGLPVRQGRATVSSRVAIEAGQLLLILSGFVAGSATVHQDTPDVTRPDIPTPGTDADREPENRAGHQPGRERGAA